MAHHTDPGRRCPPQAGPGSRTHSTTADPLRLRARQYLAELTRKARERSYQKFAEDLDHLVYSKTDAFYVSNNSTVPGFSPGSKSIRQAVEPEQLVDIVNSTSSPVGQSVCVIEDISPWWIGVLGSAWDIPFEFFLNHQVPTTSATGMLPKLQETTGMYSREWRYEERHSSGHDTYRHIAGRFHYTAWNMDPSSRSPWTRETKGLFRRPVYGPGGGFGLRSDTVISYCRPVQDMYLILVDAPLKTEDFQKHRDGISGVHYLWLPCSRSGTPLALPQSYGGHAGVWLSGLLMNAFKQSWHLEAMFRVQSTARPVVPPAHLMYMLTCSTWEDNLQMLAKDIKRISFLDIRSPNRETNRRLHDLRMKLVELQDQVIETRDDVPAVVEEYSLVGDRISIRERLGSISSRLPKSEKLLMESFSLLMSSITVIDSQTSVEQSKRGAMLTKLALIYVPLSFVTSIFGMNVREINDSPLSVWVCFVALAIVGPATLIAFWILEPWEDRWKGALQHRTSELRENLQKRRDASRRKEDHRMSLVRTWTMAHSTSDANENV